MNKRRIQNLAKTGLFVTVLGLFALAFPPIILLAVPVVIVSRLSERRASRQKWPSISQVESGQRRFEVKRGQLFSIQLAAPRALRSGYAKIVPVTGDPIVLSIARNKNFMAARTVLYAFDPARVNLDE